MTIAPAPKQVAPLSPAYVPQSRKPPVSPLAALLPLAVTLGLVGLWWVLSRTHVLPEAIFPSPEEVFPRLWGEARSGRLLRDIVASLYRVAIAFVLSAGLGVPLGLFLGLNPLLRAAFLPFVNFLRALSPLAWLPFAVYWFGLGDKSSIFLIFMAVTFPLTIATMAATAGIPTVYFRVAKDHNLPGVPLLTEIVLPAILPQVIVAFRVGVGVAWVVIVAAEMLAGRDGLGFLVSDARNGVANDLLVAAMLVIGVIGMILDRVLMLLTRLPSVRWGYEG